MFRTVGLELATDILFSKVERKLPLVSPDENFLL